MPLDELNKSLYDPNSKSELKKRAHKESRFDPQVSREAGSGEFQKKEEWVKEKKGLSDNQRKAIKITLWAIGAIALLGVILIVVFKIKQSAFSEEKVLIDIEGSAVIDSTQLVQYAIHYKNDNRVDLKDASILLNHSENFQPESATNLQTINAGNSKIYIGTIKSRSQGEVVLKGRFYAPKDYVVYLRGRLDYMPSNFNSVFQAQSQIGINVKTSPIFLEVAAPMEAASGNDAEYLIDYKNQSPRSFSDVRVKVEYPEGFQFTSGDPRPSEGDNFWYIGNLSPDQSGKIRILGTVRGSRNEGKIVKVYIGSSGDDGQFVAYTQDEKATKIVASPLGITQSIGGLENLTINAGETLNYSLNYQNEGEIGLRDVIIVLEIKTDILDFSKLKLQKGSYDGAKGAITWKAPDFPQLSNLAPGQSGEIQFSVPALDRIPVKNENDKDFSVITVAKIDSPDVPASSQSNKIIASNTLELKLNSKVILETTGYYNDSGIANFGPIPPQVGKETSYVIHWQITNVSNDISDVKVVSSLPTGINWKEKILPENEKIIYNERTNQIVWEIGKLKNGAGILTPKKEVSFQISVTPQVNQKEQEARLLNPSFLEAKDLFTRERLKYETKEKTTILSEDQGIGGNYKVVDADSGPG